MPPPIGFHGCNTTHEIHGFGMTQVGKECSYGDGTWNKIYGWHGRTQIFWMWHNYTSTQFNLFNNWFYCFSYEYDIYHDRYKCPWDLCISNHNPFINRANAHLFPGGSICGVCKTILPGQPGHPIQYTWLLGMPGHNHVEHKNNINDSTCTDLHPKKVTKPKSTNL